MDCFPNVTLGAEFDSGDICCILNNTTIKYPACHLFVSSSKIDLPLTSILHRPPRSSTSAKMLKSFVSVLALVATGVRAAPAPGVTNLAVTATTAAVLPNPTQVYINAITYGGTGCPQGSVGSFISADRQT